jgi:hypothetical protein
MIQIKDVFYALQVRYRNLTTQLPAYILNIGRVQYDGARFAINAPPLFSSAL